MSAVEKSLRVVEDSSTAKFAETNFFARNDTRFKRGFLDTSLPIALQYVDFQFIFEDFYQHIFGLQTA